MRIVELNHSGKINKVIANNEDSLANLYKIRIENLNFIFNEFGLTGWRFIVVNQLKPERRIAETNREYKAIVFSMIYLYLLNWETIWYIVHHELAHALCPPGCGHGVNWRLRCLTLGVVPVNAVPRIEFRLVEGDIYKITFKHPQYQYGCQSDGFDYKGDYTDLPI